MNTIIRLSLIFFISCFCFNTVAQDIDFDLILAADTGDSLKVDSLLQKGANPNAQTGDGITPLMYATQNGHLSIVKILIDKGVDVNKAPYNGITALMAACRANREEIAELLVKSGADINATDINGISPLLYAVYNNYFYICDMLIYYGAKPISDKAGNRPLNIAAYMGYTDIVELLIRKKENIDVKDNLGFTPLMSASQNGFLDCVQLLVGYGADVNLANNNNLTALCLATQNGHEDIVKFLLDNKADANHQINSKISPLTLAQIGNQKSTAKILRDNGAKYSPLPYFNKLVFGFPQTTNFQDYTSGLDIEWLDCKYNISLFGGTAIRPFRNAVLLQQSNELYYQLRERRFFAYAGLQKNFTLPLQKNWLPGLSLSIKEVFSWGDFDGMKRKPDNKFSFVPSAGVFLQSKVVGFSLHYEYFDLKTEQFSPHRVVFSTKFVFRTDKQIVANKIVELY